MTDEPSERAELVGAVHVHTRHSDGSGYVEDVLDDARRAGLDFIMITDHGTDAARRKGFEGWHDGLLVVVGAELSFGRGAHVLVFGVEDVEALERLEPERALKTVRERGGLAVAAHPQGIRKPTLGIFHRPWEYWDNPDFGAIELWSFMYDWARDFKWRRFFDFHRDPHSKLAGPEPEVLRGWDQVTRRRPLVAVGSLDAHARRVVFRRYTFFPYEFLFRTVVTCVTGAELTGRTSDDVGALIRAIAAGRCYVANRQVAPARGFHFEVAAADESFEMGSVVTFGPGLVARIRTPARGEIRLVADGVPFASAGGTGAEFEISKPAVYRTEVRYAGRPWIYSNPVYIRSEGGDDPAR
jgi:hypothetical protein